MENAVIYIAQPVECESLPESTGGVTSTWEKYLIVDQSPVFTYGRLTTLSLVDPKQIDDNC